MSERPFMQLYVSDFIGDTLALSTEQIGAYMLLLMAMWNAGGRLPDDDAKLARVVRMSVKKWRAIKDDLAPFFERESGEIWHNRLTKELRKSERKSQSRADAGAKGGAAKALKDKQSTLAIATPEPCHSPDTRVKEEANASSKKPTRARQIPDDFQPDIGWAVERGLSRQSAILEAEKFANYWRGEGKPKKDWNATWRTWVLKAIQYHGRGQSPPRQTRTESAIQQFLARGEDDEQHDPEDGQRNVLQLPAFR